MLLGIEPRTCPVCGKGLYRNVTWFRGGWARCSVCNEFVHYSCCASGRVKFLKQRPRLCKLCRAQEGQPVGAARPGRPQPGSPKAPVSKLVG